MTEKGPSKLFTGNYPADIEWAAQGSRHIFISDLHLNPTIPEHVNILPAIFKFFEKDTLIFGGDTFDFELLPRAIFVPSDIEILHAFAHLVGNALEKTFIIPGNHDPYILFFPLLKYFEKGSETKLHTSLHTISPAGRDVYYSHGSQLDPLTAISGIPFIRRATNSLGRSLDNKLEDEKFAKGSTLFPRFVQRVVTKNLLPPDSTSVIGHSHYTTRESLPMNRELIISGSSHGDTLVNVGGSFFFRSVINDGENLTHMHYRFEGKDQTIREVIEV